MRVAAVEQGREQALEVGVDLLERGEQPHPPLAVEAADRTAQAVDRLLQFVALGRPLRTVGVEFGKFAFRHQIDRPEPLALGGQSLERLALGLGGGEVGRVELEFRGQQRRRAFELLAAFARQFLAPRGLCLGACGGPGAGFASRGEPLACFAQCMRRIGDGLLGLCLGGGSGADQRFARCRFAFDPVDLGGEAVGLGGDVGALGGQRGGAVGGVDQAVARFLATLAPFAGFALRRSVAFAVGGEFSRPGCGGGAAVGNLLTGG